MASVRMTNELREGIIRTAMLKAFAKEKAKNEEDLKILSRKIYDKLYSKQVQDAIKILPPGFVELDKNRTVRVTPHKGHVPITINLEFGDDRVAFSAAYRYGDKPIVIDSEIYEETLKLCESTDKVEESTKILHNNLVQVVYSASTVAKLIEMWPEGEKFIPDWAKGSAVKTNLPAVCVSNLNNLLAIALDTPASAESGNE